MYTLSIIIPYKAIPKSPYPTFDIAKKTFNSAPVSESYQSIFFETCLFKSPGIPCTAIYEYSGHGETEKSIFILDFLVGLGFGLTEFFFYVFGGASLYIRLPGIFFHAASTSITAYGIATNRAIPFYLLATALHLSYNFFVAFGDLFWLIVAYAFLKMMSLKTHRHPQKCTSNTI